MMRAHWTRQRSSRQEIKCSRTEHVKSNSQKKIHTTTGQSRQKAAEAKMMKTLQDDVQMILEWPHTAADTYVARVDTYVSVECSGCAYFRQRIRHAAQQGLRSIPNGGVGGGGGGEGSVLT